MCLQMSDRERNVILMVDEIHISSTLSYKAGKLEESASNCQISESTSVQLFMISSSNFSKTEDDVDNVPVKNINASTL